MPDGLPDSSASAPLARPRSLPLAPPPWMLTQSFWAIACSWLYVILEGLDGERRRSLPCSIMAVAIAPGSKDRRSYCEAYSLPDWLKEVRSLRGSVLFDNGRRPHFKTGNGRFCDADPIDLYAYHILAYDRMRLIGCVRVYPLELN